MLFAGIMLFAGMLTYLEPNLFSINIFYELNHYYYVLLLLLFYNFLS
jgi:hypothetical protein